MSYSGEYQMRSLFRDALHYIPWKHIRSWNCIRCGRCCREFQINLRFYDYARIAQHWPETVDVDHTGVPFIKRAHGRCVFQHSSGLCRLQPQGMKPIICKLWPFKVFPAARRRGHDNARFHYKDGDFFVYLNPFYKICPGINRGVTKDLPLVVKEIIEIFHNLSRDQQYSTAR